MGVLVWTATTAGIQAGLANAGAQTLEVTWAFPIASTHARLEGVAIAGSGCVCCSLLEYKGKLLHY